MTCNRTKGTYLLIECLSVYVHENLVESIKAKTGISILCDKATNVLMKNVLRECAIHPIRFLRTCDKALPLIACGKWKGWWLVRVPASGVGRSCRVHVAWRKLHAWTEQFFSHPDERSGVWYLCAEMFLPFISPCRWTCLRFPLENRWATHSQHLISRMRQTVWRATKSSKLLCNASRTRFWNHAKPDGFLWPSASTAF